MRETNKAKQAFEDYFNLGPGRSLRLLRDLYKAQTNPEARPPTKQLATIKIWSSNHKWQDRIGQRQQEIAEAQFEAIKGKAIKAGYAYWPSRVKDLIALGELLLEEINTEDKRWLPDVKQIGSGKDAERVDLVRFNSPLIEQFRRTLDDIASEMGERKQVMELGTGDGQPLIIRVLYGDDSPTQEATPEAAVDQE